MAYSQFVIRNKVKNQCNLLAFDLTFKQSKWRRSFRVLVTTNISHEVIQMPLILNSFLSMIDDLGLQGEYCDKYKQCNYYTNMRANNHNNIPSRLTKDASSPAITRPIRVLNHPQTKPTGSNDKKSNKSNSNSNKNSRTQLQLEPKLRDQYFNNNKMKIVKNVVYHKNDDYGAGKTEIKLRTEVTKQDGNKDGKEKDLLNKLKFKSPRGVIGFDGKAVMVEPTPVGRSTCQNRSLEHFTQILPKSQCSKPSIRKVKSKSQPKAKKSSQRASKSHKKNKELQNLNVNSKKEIKEQKSSDLLLMSFERTTLRKPLFQSEQQMTQPESPHIYQFSQFYTQQLDVNTVFFYIKKQQLCLKVNYLKKVSRQNRSACVKLISRICYEMKLSKDIFFLAVELVDRYCNQQIMVARFKVLALASLLLCIKFYDRSVGMYLNSQIFKNGGKTIGQLETGQSQIQIQKYNHKEMERQKKQKNIIQIVQLLQKFDEIIYEQLDNLPSADQIMEFQTLILVRENFNIHRNDLSYWLDILTLHWDRFVFLKHPRSIYSKKCLFRLPQIPQNYYYLAQIIQSCLHSLEIYSQKYSRLILTTIFLICRIVITLQSQSDTKQVQKSFNQHKNNLPKSNNLLFVDKMGINDIFGQFLQLFQMQIGDILDCCKFVSQFLDYQIIETISQDKAKTILQGKMKGKFYRHYHNPRISANLK